MQEDGPSEDRWGRNRTTADSQKARSLGKNKVADKRFLRNPTAHVGGWGGNEGRTLLLLGGGEGGGFGLTSGAATNLGDQRGNTKATPSRGGRGSSIRGGWQKVGGDHRMHVRTGVLKKHGRPTRKLKQKNGRGVRSSVSIRR